MNPGTHPTLNQTNGNILHCVWMDAGVVDYKLCDQGYDCDRCPFDEALHGRRAGHSSFLQDRDRDLSVQGCVIANNLFYHSGHTWARVEESGVVRVGLDDFGQRMLGHVYSLSQPPTKTIVKSGEESSRLTHQSGVTPLAAPVSGTIRSINSKLAARPALLNRDPYGEGWTTLIEPADLKSSLRGLMYGEKVRDWLVREIEKLRSLINSIVAPTAAGEVAETNHKLPSVPRTMTDGGLLDSDLLKGLNVAQKRRVISSFFPLTEIDQGEIRNAILVRNVR